MKTINPVLLLIGFLFFVSCGGGGTTDQQTEEETADTTLSGEPGEGQAAVPDCQLGGKMLEGNRFYSREQNLLIAIVADSSTYDENLGDSHRVLEIYDSRTCERIDRKELPVNVSPDFPYYIAEITYNKAHQLVGIRGFGNIFCYDVESRSLLAPLEPKFKNERYGVDAQSGMIKRLEVWEDYLIGYAQDYGTFAFDLGNKAQPEPVLPFAEFESEERFYSLFLLPLDNGNFQAIMPDYDIEADQFAVNPMLTQPAALSTNVSAAARNNRYLVLRQTSEGNAAVAFDLLRRQRIELPDNVKTQRTQDVLSWIRSNQ
jgi:hypothetical protein